jgi:uncharacterized protein YndB with AHSA1/START domain
MARTSEMKSETASVKPEPLVISRHFAAPRDLVFKAWSSAEHIKRWFSPEGYSVPEAEIDFRASGVFAVCMRMPSGEVHWMRGAFDEVSAPDRLAFTAGVTFDGEKRFTVHTAVTFEDDGMGTRMTVRQAYDIHDPAFLSAVKGAAEGWRTTLDKLEREIARIEAAVPRSVVHAIFSLERVYDASPALVFRALSDPAAKARWFEGGGGWTPIERTMDVRPGGRERARGRWPNGLITTFDAVYFDVVPNRRLVYCYEMHLDARKISVSLATIDLAPAGASTRLKLTEQGAFLDGYDDAGSREHGTGLLLDRLGASLGA